MRRSPLSSKVLGHAALALACTLVPSCLDFSDAATRLAEELRDEASALRASKATTRTFEHRPKRSPEGISGDYRVVFSGTTASGPGPRYLLVGDGLEGPIAHGTSSHSSSVIVARDFTAAHHTGEPTSITLEKRGSAIWVVDVR